MLSDVTVGQFFPGRSVLHRLDPRVKLAITFLYIIAIFIPSNWYGLAAAVAAILFAAALSRLPVRLLLKGLKPVIPLLILTAVINLFYGRGEPLWEWWIFSITQQGIESAVFIAVRILCLVEATSLLTYTTSPTTLTDALERLLSPLKIIRLPVHDIAMMMTIALRFIPTLIEETDKIMSAQKARGADMESGNLIKRAKALIPVLIPLLISSFRRAIDLATAMECRCYHGGEGRTRMKQFQLQLLDYVALTLMVLLIAGMIVSNILV